MFGYIFGICSGYIFSIFWFLVSVLCAEMAQTHPKPRSMFKTQKNDRLGPSQEQINSTDFNLSEGCFPIFSIIFYSFIQILYDF